MKKNNIIVELSKFAKLIAPEVVRTKIVQRDHILSLRLKWKYYPRTLESRHSVWWGYIDKNLDHKDYHAITNSVRKNIDNAISKFGKDQCDFLIGKFGLYEVYRDAFEDKNVMYKVKRNYDRKIGNAIATKNLSFYYFDEIKISLPDLYYFWILLLRKRFNHDNFGPIFDITHSVVERIKQLFFTYNIIEDIIKDARHHGNPDTAFVFFYHFGYFVSLVKTIGDNLAWLLRLYLRLSIGYYDADINSDKFKSNLKLRLHYYNIIYSNSYYEEYKKLTRFRDIFQHRHIIRDIRVLVTTGGQNKIMIPKNPQQYISDVLKVKGNVSSSQRTAEKEVLIAEATDSAIIDGLHESFLLSENELSIDYEDPLIFCKRHLNGISSLINGTFSRIAIETTRKLIGEVTNFYPKKGIAVIDVLHGKLKVADEILIEGATTSLQQQNTSMEIDHNKVEKCDNGLVGMKANGRVRVKDKVYKIRKIDNDSFIPYVYGYIPNGEK